MFYSTRHFIRIVIILILIYFILRQLPFAVMEFERFIGIIIRFVSRILRNIRIR